MLKHLLWDHVRDAVITFRSSTGLNTHSAWIIHKHTYTHARLDMLLLCTTCALPIQVCHAQMTQLQKKKQRERESDRETDGQQKLE